MKAVAIVCTPNATVHFGNENGGYTAYYMLQQNHLAELAVNDYRIIAMHAEMKRLVKIHSHCIQLICPKAGERC